MRLIAFRTQARYLIRRAGSSAAVATLSGLCAFGLALALLRLDGFGFLRATPPELTIVRPTEAPSAPPALNRSAAADLVAAGHMAVGVRLKSDAVPLTKLHVGTLLDVLVSLPDGPDGPGLIGAAVTGARVVAVTATGDHADVLLDAPVPAAMLLAHLVRSGSPLTYALREVADGPREFSVLTIDETRARLALSPRLAPSPEPQPAPPAPQAPVIVAQAQPEAPPPAASEVHFMVYPGVDLALIERRFDVTETALREANPGLAPSAEPLVVGIELVVPDLYGFAYRVQPADTLAGLSQRFHVSSELVQRVNDLPPDLGLPSGEEVLIPTSRPAWAVVPSGQ